MIVRLEEDGRLLKRWSCKSRLRGDAESNADLRPDLATYLRDIAYEIVWAILDGVEANSLENFKHLIDGVELFRKYKDKKEHDNRLFKISEEKLLQEIQENEGYARAYFFLVNVYSWRAYYEESNTNIIGWYEKLAQDTYEKAGRGATTDPDEAKAFRDFWMGLVDYRHYQKAKDAIFSAIKLEDDREAKTLRAAQLKAMQVHKRLENASQFFLAAWKQNQQFYFARTGRALVYKEQAEFLRDSGDKKGSEGCLNHASKELHEAKAIAADLKDIDSIKWIDKQILQLELVQRSVAKTESSGSPFLAAYKAISPWWRPSMQGLHVPPLTLCKAF